MATLRTEEEKSAIVAHCLELERTGGDILGYLWSENYLTPRATWCNFQREWLNRKPYQFTDGKPKIKKERKDMSRLVITEEQKAEAVRIAIEGRSPVAYLKGLGSKNPSGAWFNIKTQYKEKKPEIYAKIPKHEIGWKAPKPDKGMPKQDLQLEAGANYEVTVKDAMDNIQGAVDTFFGRCEEMGLKLDREKGEITAPLMYSGKKAIGWQGDFGTYIHDVKHGYIDYESNDGEELSMSVEAWRNWLKEIREVAQLMGVEL